MNIKTVTSVIIATMVFTVPFCAKAITPASTPLFLNSPVEPNIVFTLDDSGSMQWEILPENITFFAYLYPAPANAYGGTNYTNLVPRFDVAGLLNLNIRLRSPNENKIYYNPSITYKPWANQDGTLWPNAEPTCAYYNPSITGAGCLNLTIDKTEIAQWWDGSSANPPNSSRTYYPATYFKYNGGTVTTAGNYTRISITAANAPFTGEGRTNRTDCTVGSCSYEQEISNFANWFSYYRSRISLARAGIGRAFSQQNTNIRVGFAAINQTSSTIDGITSPGAMIRGVRQFSGADRQMFFSDLYSYVLNTGGTPLRRAMDNIGKYFERTDNEGPWGEFPGTNNGIQYSCRHNYNIFMTDGYWNGDAAATVAAQDNTDGTAGTEITGSIAGQASNFTYTSTPPFSDSFSNTLADVAMHYWKRDLRTDLTNNVQTSQPNPAFWQHMVNFTVGLGVNGTLNPTTDLARLTAGTINWPQPTSGSVTGVNIDDLWHAALNSRGDYFSASDPDTFAQSLSDTLKEISNRTSSSSSVATSTTELRSGTKFFQSLSTNGEWSGTLVSKLFSNNSQQWDAAEQVRTQQLTFSGDSRVIITKAGNQGVPFIYTSLTSSQQQLLDADENGILDNRGADRIGYLRGHGQHEGVSSNAFRQRPNRKIGDIVNSNPWFVGAPSAGYSEFNNPGYKAFRDTYLSRMPIVYVGSNDGMMHGFNACEVGKVYSGNVTCTTAIAVTEAIAYVPSNMYDNLSWLSSQTYADNHKYYVDGSPMVGDATVNNAWKSVLVSGLNSGGKAYFALDVTDPSDFSQANANSIFLWEFTDSDDSDLGLTYNIPSITERGQAYQISKMANGKWAVIVGNGYNSSNGKAALFIIFLDGPSAGSWTLGTHYVKLIADSSGNNGLGTPMPYDDDGDGKIDYIYAGDLKGNLWKFDVHHSESVNWEVGMLGQALFSAIDSSNVAQPIVHPPAVSRHSITGRMVLFGTGKYMETSDVFTTQEQTFYGIRDIDEVIGSSAALTERVLSSTLPRVVENTSAPTIPQLDDNGNVLELGWFIKLPSSGERVTGRPSIRNFLINFDTQAPNTDICEGGVTSINYSLDFATGAMASQAIYDTNADSTVNSDDAIVAGVSTGSNLSGVTFVKTGDASYVYIAPQLPGQVVKGSADFGDSGTRGRITWRELIQ